MARQRLLQEPLEEPVGQPHRRREVEQRVRPRRRDRVVVLVDPLQLELAALERSPDLLLEVRAGDQAQREHGQRERPRHLVDEPDRLLDVVLLSTGMSTMMS
jgi:hypothetical protein